MHRRCLHAVVFQKRVYRGIVRQYASSTSNPPSPPPKEIPCRPKTATASKERLQFNPPGHHSSKPSHRAQNAEAKHSDETFKENHKVPPWKRPKVWITRKHKIFEKRRSNGNTPDHPLLLKDKPMLGEWEPTPPRGKEFVTLKKALLSHNRRPSADSSLQAMEEPGEDDFSSAVSANDWIEVTFPPGTFVETRSNEYCTIGVVLGEAVQNRRWDVLTLSSSGEVFKHSRSDVQFAIPGFISSDLAERCGTDVITDDVRQINARVEALKKLRQLNMDVEASFNDTWMRQRSVNLYWETKSVDPTRWAKTTVKHLTHLQWQQPKIVHYYATHKYLMDHPMHFVATDNYLASQTFLIRPLRDVEEIKKVETWIADHRKDVEGPLSRFLEKARDIIQGYTKREMVKEGPMSQQPAKHSWNEEDQVFIRFLLRTLAPRRSIQNDPYTASRYNLLKVIYPKISPVTDAVTFQCLKELGVVAPWQDPFELIPLANPTGDYCDADSYNKESEAMAKRTLQSKAVAGAVLGPEDLHPVDPLDAVRHDFGNMRVFVVDEASAQELDDGISVERIPSEPDKFWVHSHIADPASLLHPGHVLSLRARDRGSTLYFLQKSFPLFPKSLVHDSTYGVSLGSRSNGDRTLTFSTKLDKDGNILDHKVRAGIVRNVRKVTYAACDGLLGIEPTGISYPFGQRHGEKPEPPVTFAKEEAADLKLLYKLAQQQVQRRFDDGLIVMDNNRFSIQLLTVPDRIQSPSMTGSIYHGFPAMEYSVANTAMTDVGSRMMVSEMMKFASRAASRVAVEHDVPMIRKAMEPIVPMSDEAHKEMLQVRTPNGYIPIFKFLNHLLILPTSTYTLQPKSHSFLGIPDGEGYSRVTSPLRRFEDLVAHWQLHHLLLGSNAPPRYPFSLSEMERLCVDVSTANRTAHKIHLSEASFHALLFMKRWTEDTKRGVPRPFGDPLAKPLTGYKFTNVRRNLLDNKYISSVVIPELGIKAQLVDLHPEFHEVPSSTPVQVKFKGIDLAINRMAFQVELA